MQSQCDMKATRKFQNSLRDFCSYSVLLKSVRIKGYTIGVVLTLVVLDGYQVKSQNNSSYRSNTSSSGFDLVDRNGNIHKLSDYRDRYQALGTFFVRDPVGGEEMHYTYASPGSAEFLRTSVTAPSAVFASTATSTPSRRIPRARRSWERHLQGDQWNSEQRPER